jgi:2-oxoisovalerate dehydrogenase E1 component
LYSQSAKSFLNVPEVPVEYGDDEEVDGRIIIRDNFAALFEKEPLLLTFGEDTGKIGDVNQGMEGMQARFGELRVSDVGIRENSILGQGLGMALRGLRPVAEIQYLDYLLYCLQPMSDDLATTQWRTKGGQKAPLIVRTRGHRLEGVWHSGSPMGMIINALRGIVVCVPRNMQQAAGMYNTLIQSDDPALVIECLNGYRTKERLPSNLGEFTVPIGIPEVVREGDDVTLVSYGSTFNICLHAADRLAELGISVEMIDARTLLPFDREHRIVESLKKTSRLLDRGRRCARRRQRIHPATSAASAKRLPLVGQRACYTHCESASRGLRHRWRLLQQAERGGCGGGGCWDGAGVRRKSSCASLYTLDPVPTWMNCHSTLKNLASITSVSPLTIPSTTAF